MSHLQLAIEYLFYTFNGTCFFLRSYLYKNNYPTQVSNHCHDILRLFGCFNKFSFARLLLTNMIYKLSHDLPKNLSHNLRKLGNIRKASKTHRMIAQCPLPTLKWKILLILAKTSRKITIKPLPQCTMPHKNQSQPQTPRERLQARRHARVRSREIGTLHIVKTNLLHENEFTPPRWDLSPTQVIFLHANSPRRTVQPRQDCPCSLASVRSYDQYMKKCNSSYKT